MAQAKVGIIGGTGFYMIEGMSEIEEVEIATPFGKPSDNIRLGTFNGVRIAFLPRHARGHKISPAELPSRANIFALKSLGVEFIISVCAVGSLKEKIMPGDIVIHDQVIDRTSGRPSTFFQNGIVCHIPFAYPFCQQLNHILYDCARQVGVRVHDGGTCIVMEGPQFSTRAESELYRSWGADTIVMTLLPEAKLAREAEICYANLSIVTDYDCWHETHESVSVELIIANLNKMVDSSKEILKLAINKLPLTRRCSCTSALNNAIATDLRQIPHNIKKDLWPIIGKYLQQEE
jgi:5'-methylthioadenosine phosphorylase